jgi:hypothetical protein
MAKDTTSRMRKYLTIPDLEANAAGAVYVLNTTEGNFEGNVVINVPRKNGNGSDLVKIPKTFIPVDIGLQVPRSQLLESGDFRKAVGNSLIKLVNPDYAVLLLASEEAKEEQARLVAEANKADTTLRKAGYVEPTGVPEDDDEYVEVDGSGNLKDPAKTKRREERIKKERTEARAKREPQIKVQQIVTDAEREEMNQVQIIARLSSVRNMTRTDLAFLSKKYKDKAKIIRFLKDKLESIKDAEREAAEA